MTAHNNPFADWSKMFGDFKAPGVDVNQVIAQYRRNAETGSTVIQIATESTQAFARRCAEISRSNAEHALKASKDMMSNATPEAAASKHADFAKNWLDYNVNSVRELAEMATKAAQEAFDALNKRATEQMKEFSEAAGSSHHGHGKKKAAA
jgi:phasin family protein